MNKNTKAENIAQFAAAMRIPPQKSKYFYVDDNTLCSMASTGYDHLCRLGTSEIKRRVSSINFYSVNIATLLSVVFGWLGVDRLYTGNYILAILKFIIIGVPFISVSFLSNLGALENVLGTIYLVYLVTMWWWVIDWFAIRRTVRRKNANKYLNKLHYDLDSGKDPEKIKIPSKKFNGQACN